MSKYFKTTENYNPGGLAPFPAAAIWEIQTPNLRCHRPQGPVSVSGFAPVSFPIGNIGGNMLL